MRAIVNFEGKGTSVFNPHMDVIIILSACVRTWMILIVLSLWLVSVTGQWMILSELSVSGQQWRRELGNYEECVRVTNYSWEHLVVSLIFSDQHQHHQIHMIRFARVVLFTVDWYMSWLLRNGILLIFQTLSSIYIPSVEGQMPSNHDF